MKQLKYQLRLFRKMIEGRWGALPLKKQHKYIRSAFVFYVVITLAVIIDICLNSDRHSEVIQIDRIENPVIRKPSSKKLSIDTISLLQKKPRL